MKNKVIIFVLSCLLLTGCGNQTENLESLVIQNKDITEISVSHVVGGESEEYVCDDDEIEEFQEWIGSVEVKDCTFKQEEDPASMNGGEVYSFSGDGIKYFSYFISEKEAYVRVDEDWYKVIRK